MIRFRDGKPIGIWYSQHVTGAAYKWDHKALSMKDDRVCSHECLLTKSTDSLQF